MKKFLMKAIASALMAGFAVVVWSGDLIVVNPHAAKEFARLPADLVFPEGITANPVTGDIFVGTFDASGTPANALLRYGKSGRLEARRDLIPPLLDLAYNALDNKIYFVNFGGSAIERIDADFDAASEVETVAAIPLIGPPGDRLVPNPDGTSDTIMFENVFPAPNALVFDSNGNLYVSDSFQGAVFVVASPHGCTTPCVVDTFVHDPLLATAGFPPFGANGIALDAGESSLFIANTGDDRILRLDLNDPAAPLAIFAESINGADGLAMDAAGRLWVAANQADHVTVLDGNGKVIAELGEHLGVTNEGSTRGLSFPASLVIVGNQVFVTNLALPLTPTSGDEPEETVTTYTISRINIPVFR